MHEIRSVSIVGMGALGLMYGGHIIKACGKDAVRFVMDTVRVEKYKNETFTVNGEKVDAVLCSAEDAVPADLLIVAVKYPGLESAFEVMKNCIGKDTIVISVMNGISSEKLIKERFPEANMVYAVAQGMDAMKFGNALRYTQMGNIHVGSADEEDRDNLKSLCAFFDRIQLPYVFESDILYRIWFKFMLNVGINQTCMVYNTTYEGATTPGTEAYCTLVAAMREARVLAEAEGIHLSEADLNKCIEIERTLDPNGTPSMGQDRINRKESELDMFAGTVISMAAKHNILVPANEFLYRRAKEIESEYVK